MFERRENGRVKNNGECFWPRRTCSTKENTKKTRERKYKEKLERQIYRKRGHDKRSARKKGNDWETFEEIMSYILMNI